jgi:signal peptidase I
MRRYARRLLLLGLAGLCACVCIGFGLVTTGSVSIVITHGVSMEPTYHQGDLVVVLKRPTYRTGQIAAYTRPGHAEVILHRIVGGAAGGYVFKGDNNASMDPTTPSEEQLTGRAVLHFPNGGSYVQRLSSPPALAGAAFLLMGAGSATVRTRRNRKRRHTMTRHAARTPAHSRLNDLPPSLLMSAAAGVLLGIVSLAAGAAGWLTPLPAPSERPLAGRSMTFGYSSSVPPSAAYDGTAVSSPDPVFRNLTDKVDIHLSYRGAPGTLAVRGELSTPSGWHTTIPLAPATGFTGSQYRTTVALDLAALERKATAAAAVIGLPAAPVSVKVVADLKPTGQASFTPSLALSLSPLQLSLPGGVASLVVQDTPAAAASARRSGQLSLLGQTTSATSLRLGSVLGLVASLLLLGVTAYLARSTASRPEAARIHRRYASLLVAVQPIPNTPGRPVVDVTEFATLAKLAERYGLLVLHWSRTDIETFIVQDEGTTFRFRTGSAPAVNVHDSPSFSPA